MSLQISGACCCGAIRYTATEPRPIWYCHCEQCRRMTGHYMAAAQVALTNIEISGNPKWFYVSKVSRHGFCPDCGSQLFWRNDKHAHLSVTAGTMDDTSSLTTNGHVFCSEKGAYYKIADDEPQFARWDGDYFPSA